MIKRSRIKVVVNVSFIDRNVANGYNHLTDRIKNSNVNYRWEKTYQENESSFSFILSTYEEYEAIVTNAALMGGVIVHDISLNHIAYVLEEKVERKERASQYAKARMKAQYQANAIQHRCFGQYCNNSASM